MSATGIPPAQLETYYLHNARLFTELSIYTDLAYDPNTQTLTAIGPVSAAFSERPGTTDHNGCGYIILMAIPN